MKSNQSVQRAAAILRAAATHAAGETATGLARTAGLSRATALRLIRTLEGEGFLERRGDGRYAIGPGLIGLSPDAGPAYLMGATARAALDQVAAETHESVTLSVVRGHETLDVVLQVDSPHLIQAVSWVGRRYPLHASSSGKVLLAGLEPARLEQVLLGGLDRHAPGTITDPERLRRELGLVRRQGYAVIVDELEEGLASVSVPIADRGGRLVATLNLTGPSFRFDAERRLAALTPMRAAVARIEATIAGAGP
jgi:DNA-binding IclR family transcriptional regulator